MKNIKLLTLLFTSLIVFNSCDKDDDEIIPLPVNQEEVITTVRLILTGGGQVVTLTVKDLDGDGPNAPVISQTGTISANTTYLGEADFLNELVIPAVELTEEIEAEGVDHQIFYQAPSSIGAFTYSDLDAYGKPIGLQFTYLTGSSTSGNLIVTLRHEPNKSAAGVSSGNIANAGGSTDAEVVFPIVVN